MPAIELLAGCTFCIAARDMQVSLCFRAAPPSCSALLHAGARLVDMVVPPAALVEPTSQLRLHALYYITKQIIPAMERVLSLMGVDIRAWFAALPRPQRLLPQKRPPRGEQSGDGAFAAGARLGGRRPATGGLASTIDRYYLSRHCAVREWLGRCCRVVEAKLPRDLLCYLLICNQATFSAPQWCCDCKAHAHPCLCASICRQFPLTHSADCAGL